MKNIISGALSIFIILIINNAYGQNIQEARYKFGDKELAKLWEEKYTEARKKGDFDVCLISVTFAKFTIDSLGNIDNISISENGGTPKIFREILISVIKSTSGSWFPRTINNKAVESKPFLWPFIYQLEAGCSLSRKSVTNGTDNELIRLLTDFHDSDNTERLDCIILKPIRVFSQN